MNKQEIFNTVVTHLRKQNRQALSGNRCCYKTPDGDKCAVGCLIPDEHFYPEMNDAGVVSALMWSIDFPIQLHWMRSHESLLKDLQKLHDCKLPDYWEEEFTNLAICYGLTVPEKNS